MQEHESHEVEFPRGAVLESEEVRNERLHHTLESLVAAMAGQLTMAALDEAIRFLKTGTLDSLSGEDFRFIEDRHGIVVNDEAFFAKAFTGGKEISALLRLAKDMGTERALQEFEALRAVLQGPESSQAR